MGNTPSTQKNGNNGGVQVHHQRRQTAERATATAPSSNSQHSTATTHPTPTTFNPQLSTAAPSLESARAIPIAQPQNRYSASDALRNSQQGINHFPLAAPPHRSTPTSNSTSPPIPNSFIPAAMGNSHSRPLAQPLPIRDPRKTESPRPTVTPARSNASKKSSAVVTPLETPNNDPTVIATAEFFGPPRLPLPIESEDHVPGSPVISPDEYDGQVNPLEADFPPVKNQSILSDKTVDDDDVGDDLSTVAQGILPPVPTIIEWRDPGTKVYVTGTFADWDRKYRLHKG
jgi:hypothetical protein